MRLSKNAEKLLLLLYRKDKGENVKISSDTMKMPTDSVAKVWEELERKYDKEKLVSALYLGIEQYVETIKSHFQTIRFCLDETEKQKDDREGRIYLLIDKKYNIREI